MFGPHGLHTHTFAPAFELNKESASLSDQLTVPGDIIEFSPCCCPLLRCCHTGDPWMNRLRPNVISREIGGWGGSQDGAKLQMVGIGRGASRQMFRCAHADTT